MTCESALCEASAAFSSPGSLSIRMSVTTTSAPARARARQSARPKPRDPPVTTATLPVRSNMRSGSLAGFRCGVLGRLVLDELGPGQRAPLAQDVAADHQSLDLRRPFPDLIDLG